MRRFIFAVVLCISLLGLGSALFISEAHADQDVILSLLNMPAPPPKNPLMPVTTANYEGSFFDKETPPPDDAPIEDLIAYWTRQHSLYRELGYNIGPSPRVASRLFAEISRDPSLTSSLLNVFRGSEDGSRFFADLYERTAQDPNFDKDIREQLKDWLIYESPHFSNELEKRSLAVTDVGEYVKNHDDLLALVRQDWNKAAPIVNQLYSDTANPVSKIAATWALYRHAMESAGVSDVDRYRDELKAVVEDRSATDAMRDLALDALVKEKDWPGRDDWYFSLMSDETLDDLRVNGQSYTGLTTIIHYAPKNKYKDKMIEFAGSSNKAVRTAAVKNLMVIVSNDISDKDVDIARAMLPWLTNKDWCEAGENVRATYIRMFEKVKLPEAVPGLISLLDEKEMREADVYPTAGDAVNAAAYAANAAANATNAAANAAVSIARQNSGTVYYGNAINANSNVSRRTRMVESTPHRMAAISALDNQADHRAAPYLRRLLNDADGYVREMLVSALVVSGGFTIPEQVAGIESLTKLLASATNEIQSATNALIANMGITDESDLNDPEIQRLVIEQISKNYGRIYNAPETETIENIIGGVLTRKPEPSEELVRAVIDRILYLDKRDPQSATALRGVLKQWKGTAVNKMLLADLKNGNADADTVVKLLAIRKELREKQITDVQDAQQGKPSGASIAACILEDPLAMESRLSGDAESAAAVLACARLTRGRLPIPKVIDLMENPDKRLSLAAESYLESEDSVESRRAILARYPGKARILGAKSFFAPSNSRSAIFSMWIPELFASVGSYADHGVAYRLDQFSDEEKHLQNEVLSDQKLLGVYSYQSDQIRIYADRVTYRNVEDESRFRERPMSSEEFDYLRQYLTHYNVDELTPFISCGTDCDAKQLLMLGRNGGRRVYNRTKTSPEFFAGLEKFLAEVRSQPSELKYAAGSEINNLQILFAEKENEALTVWKNGNDLRLLVRNDKTRERVRKELSEILENSINEDYEIVETLETEKTNQKEFVSPYDTYRLQTQARAYEGISWFGVNNGRLSEVVASPENIEIPPVKDSLKIPAEAFRWQTSANGVELRADDSGLFKVSRGQLVKISDGIFSNIVVSSNGRWAIANYSDEESDYSLVRIDLANGRRYPVETNESETDRPAAYIESTNRFLLMNFEYEGHHYGEYGGAGETELPVRGDLRGRSFALLEPETGKIQKIAGEFRPIAQQTFRRLQQAGKPHEFWAAIPDSRKNETIVGIYDSRTFGFKPIATLPKISFDSMQMWVDEQEQKIYFVYRGHLLAAPLSRATQP